MERVLDTPKGLPARGWLSSTPSESERPERPPRRWFVLQGATLLLAAAVTAFALLTRSAVPPVPPQAGAEGLPQTADYHGLLVAPDDPFRVLLGTHDGVFESLDGGVTWKQTTLVGSDAMSLTSADSTVWASGHNVLALSNDGGETWSSVLPHGLPSLDIHAFTVNPSDSQDVYAAVAGHGLYRSTDGGVRFELVTTELGASVVSLVFADDGFLLASDSERGLLTSEDEGKSWGPLMSTKLLGLAVNPGDRGTVLAAGPGVLLSWDNGHSFKEVLDIAGGAGSVAWAPSDTDVGYALGRDGVIYRTADRGSTWQRAAAPGAR